MDGYQERSTGEQKTSAGAAARNGRGREHEDNANRDPYGPLAATVHGAPFNPIARFSHRASTLVVGGTVVFLPVESHPVFAYVRTLCRTARVWAYLQVAIAFSLMAVSYL